MTDRRALLAAASGEERRLEAMLEAIGRAAAAGVDWIQIREKDLPARQLPVLARRSVAAAQTLQFSPGSADAHSQPGAAAPLGPGARILINDRLDVALAAGAAGVHLGEESLPVSEVVRWRRETERPEFLIGASCHSLAAAREAERSGADYVIFGPVFATPSKAAYGPPQGLDRLAEVCRQVRIPVLAIGGITVENAAQCFAADAAGIAAIRLFQESADFGVVVSQLRSLL